MRGENVTFASQFTTCPGTPPHAWGKPLLRASARFLTRYTPTCVGKTRNPQAIARISTVHPHMRGENDKSDALVCAIAWYTPTCVGKTASISSTRRSFAVHPHMRGENATLVKGNLMQIGTPPHAWGKLVQGGYQAVSVRYTPTCVGKTPRRSKSRAPQPVHPHMRGENVARCYGLRGVQGTPPHAWGKRGRASTSTGSRRYTPTCVGKTIQ